MGSPIKGWTHPEQREGEVYMYNTVDHVHYSRWKTARIGQVAYAIGGRPLRPDSGPDSYPVFVQRSEIEAAGETIRDWI
jgi:hypothetical protein